VVREIEEDDFDAYRRQRGYDMQRAKDPLNIAGLRPARVQVL